MLKVIPKFCNGDYTEILKRIFYEDDLQENYPRYDLQKTLIFTRDIEIEELRYNLEQLIGINQQIAFKTITYIFPYKEINLISDLPNEVKKIKHKRNILFIRGSIDFHNLEKVKQELTAIVNSALKELKQKYHGRIK